MNATTKIAVHAASWGIALAVSASAYAGDAVGEGASTPASATVQSAHEFDLGPGLSDAELDAHSGGADLHLNELNAKAVVSDNYAGNLMTGNNTISDNAFGNTAGVPMVVQNTGNNVSIQNSTILNLNLR